MARIFISYRRRDSAYIAAMLKEKLQQHFGQDSVFYDIDDIPLGVDFRQYIGNAVGQCDVLLIIIGDRWTEATDSKGGWRLNDPTDYVRIEIESALKRGIPVVPVLVADATLPSASALPESLQSIVYRNAAEIRAGADTHQHIERLIRGLAKICKPKSAAEIKPPPSKNPVGDNPAQKNLSKEEKRTKALNVIKISLGDYSDNSLFIGEDIPATKLLNAIKSYALEVEPQDVLLLLDGTFFGTAGCGVILSVNGIYWRGLWSYPEYCHYVEIKSVEVYNSDLLINKIRVPTPFGEAAKKAQLLAKIVCRLREI